MLEPDEPAPFEVIEGSAHSPYLITVDHGGRRLPRALGDLGLSEAELQMHIAWDIGAAALARKLGAMLEAFVITQTYSRLAIDCNRPLEVPSSIVKKSEHVIVPGNQDVSAEQAAQRAQAIFVPYHARIVAELERRLQVGQPTILIAMHSFTPVFHGDARTWHCGMLYQRDARLGRALLALLRAEPGLVVGDNEPYAVSDHSDYGIVQYGERRGLLHVEIEVRQDLIAQEPGQRLWADRLARLLPLACAHAQR